MIEQERLIKIDINEEMKQAYIDYSMSVIVSRALPDVRDGFKPVHRRVLFGMNELGAMPDKPYYKSARIVGEVMGKYHPHGDSSIYGTLVRMAQPWALRYTLVDGQGNFGSVDGDGAAAMRYTEARMSKIALEMLKDIDKETVDFDPNFDERLKEPRVLPARLPNLLVNGANGIAVGMATNMPTHNLSETVDAIAAYIDNQDLEVSELMHYIKGPDFPTGGIICGCSGIKDAFETGRGRIVIRSKTNIEVSDTGHERIIVTEIPYGVNKAELIESIRGLASEGKITGISNVNDESDRQGMRIVIDVKRDANANVVINHLMNMTALMSSFSVNNIALVKGRPKLLNLKDLIKYFVEHRLEVVTRRTEFDLRKAQERAHILEGLIVAVDNIDEVVRIIRASRTPADAQRGLEARFQLDELQSKAIVDMRLSQLTGLRIDELKNEYAELMKLINDLNDILAHIERRYQIIKDELAELKEKYGDERCTEIDPTSDIDFNPEDFYADDEMVITISHLGYIKRTPLTEFRTQNRGGVGSRGGSSRDEDFIESLYNATMHNYMLFFTQKGRCYWLKVYDIPEGTKVSKGRAIQNLLNIEADDKVNAVINISNLQDEEFCKSHYLMFCTKQGVVKKTCLEAYSRPRQNGVNAITIRDDDRVIQVCLTTGDSEILLANKNGRAIRFHESQVREMGRTATGVRGMTIDGDDDEIIGMVCGDARSNESILVISEKGYGKRTNIVEKDEQGNIVLDENGQPNDIYRITHRGGKGVRTMNITEKTGKLVAIMSVSDDNDLMIINKSGITIRLKVADLRLMGRATQGVRLINLEKRNDEIASVCKVSAETEEPENETPETTETINNEE